MSCVMCSCYQEGQSLRSTCKCYLSIRVIQDNSSRSPLLNKNWIRHVQRSSVRTTPCITDTTPENCFFVNAHMSLSKVNRRCHAIYIFFIPASSQASLFGWSPGPVARGLPITTWPSSTAFLVSSRGSFHSTCENVKKNINSSVLQLKPVRKKFKYTNSGDKYIKLTHFIPR